MSTEEKIAEMENELEVELQAVKLENMLLRYRLKRFLEASTPRGARQLELKMPLTNVPAGQ